MNWKTPALTTGSLQHSADELQRLEVLMAELAAAVLRVTAEDMDAEISRWLKRIATSLALDRSTIAQINPATGWAFFTHCWARDPDRVITGALDLNTALPWTKQKMLAGETVVMSSLNTLPHEAAIDRESFQKYGPKSIVIVPIKVGGTAVGAISFASLNEERSWPRDLVGKFESVAEIFGFALERTRAVAEMLRLRNELSYVSKATALAELAASMAHELNQPLAAILSNAEALQAILASGRPDFEEVKAGLADIIQDDNHAREIIQRVWALFRHKEVIKSKIDVTEMLGEIARILRSEASIRNISLLIDVTQPIPSIIAERVQIRQAIINVVLNAFDAVAGIDDRPREVRVGAKQLGPSGSIQILVGDLGKGIAPAAIPKIFDPFFTTKPHGKGMRLAIAKSIVEAHSGRLSVAFNSERGTTFEIMLPISEPP
jgi:signal transduction histidine kinase